MHKTIAFLILVTFLLVTPVKAASYYLTPELRAKMAALPPEKVMTIPVPVVGVSLTDIHDTWGEARSAGRSHEGTDIFAPKGTPVASVTAAVVIGLGTELGNGNYVFTANPGGEMYYYAHLDRIAQGMSVGKIVAVGETIGYVGNTGNAAGGADHLHFGIYKDNVALNPYPRFSDQKLDDISDQPRVLAGETSNPQLIAEPEPTLTSSTLVPVRMLRRGMRGSDVVLLQQRLAKVLDAKIVADGIYGNATAAAVKTFQQKEKLTVDGIAGPQTQKTLSAKVR